MAATLEYGKNYVHLHCDSCENDPADDVGFCFEWTPDEVRDAMPLVKSLMNKHNRNHHGG